MQTVTKSFGLQYIFNKKKILLLITQTLYYAEIH